MENITNQTNNVESSSISVEEPQIATSTQPITYAKWYSRLASFFIDFLILSVISLGLALMLSPFSSNKAQNVNFSDYFKNVQSITNSNGINNINVITNSSNGVDLIAYILTLIFGLVYFAYFQSKDGQTLGMRIIGTKITNEDGSLPSFIEASIRYIIYNAVALVLILLILIPILGWLAYPILAFLWFGWCLFDKKKQNVYDKVFNNIYVPQNEKRTAAKFVVGCCCGAQLLIAISITAVIIFLVISFTNSNQANRESFSNYKEEIKINDKTTIKNSNSETYVY